ncbi:MAG: sigma-70 family RNA polymerase sigma factor [Thermodesulfovibrionales bacterium]
MTDNKLEFQPIYDAFQPKIHRYLARLAGADEADDLTQEVFMKVGQGLKDFRGESKLSTWIYRIATNASLDHLRSRSIRQIEVSAMDSETEEEVRYIPLQRKKSSIDQQLIRKEMNACIRNVIKELPEDYRAIIVLSELEDLGNREIAEILQVSLDTVKIRLHRARARLKKELENLCCFYRDERGVLSCDLKSAIRQLKESD